MESMKDILTAYELTSELIIQGSGEAWHVHSGPLRSSSQDKVRHARGLLGLMSMWEKEARAEGGTESLQNTIQG